MENKIKEINEMKVIGVKGKCRMSSTMQDIPPLWKELMENKSSIKNIVNEKIAFGVGTMIDKESFWNLSCFEVSSEEDVPEGMVCETLPAMKVAVFEHKGPNEGIKDTYEQIIHKLLPESKLETDWEKPCVEMYDERYKKDSDESVFEIWMPIK